MNITLKQLNQIPSNLKQQATCIYYHVDADHNRVQLRRDSWANDQFEIMDLETWEIFSKQIELLGFALVQVKDND